MVCVFLLTVKVWRAPCRDNRKFARPVPTPLRRAAGAMQCARGPRSRERAEARGRAVLPEAGMGEVVCVLSKVLILLYLELLRAVDALPRRK